MLEGVRSVVMVSVVYGPNERRTRSGRAPTAGEGGPLRPRGRLSSGALGQARALLDWLRGECPELAGRAVADTAPLLERDYARLAGLGWIGKNTMLISRRLGSFTFLGALLTDVELAYDPPHQANHCGTCTRCLDACPTEAFAGPYQLDARRCISYWTIEHRGLIADRCGQQLHGWVFGCDICQDVCPWNRKAPSGPDARARGTAGMGRSRPDRLADDDPQALAGPAQGDGPGAGEAGGLLRNAALVLGTRR